MQPPDTSATDEAARGWHNPWPLLGKGRGGAISRRTDAHTLSRHRCRLKSSCKVNLEKKRDLARFGFSFERGGVHTARTMMLTELRDLLSFVDAAHAGKADYLDAVQTANCLRKPVTQIDSVSKL